MTATQIVDAEPAENAAALLAAIVASSSDAILSKRLDGTITSWNASAEQMFGYTASEMIGRSIRTLIPPDRQSEEDDIIARIARGERILHYETVRLGKGGRRVDVSVSISPIHNASGAIAGASKIVRDITERKATDRALHESEQFVRRVLDNLFTFVGVMKLDGTLVEANRAPLDGAGLVPADVIGKKLWDCHWCNYAPDIQAQFVDAYNRACRGDVVRFDIPVRMKGDSRVWIDFQLSPLRSDNGQIIFLIPSGIDLTARKSAEDQLRRSYETYLHLIQNSPLGVYLVDSKFNLAQVSAGARPVFEAVRPLIGRDFSDVLRIVWKEPFASEAIALFRHTLETGEPYHSADTTQARSDAPKTESYDWQIERVALPDGTYGVVCYFYDLTERRQNEEKIRDLMMEVHHRAKNMLSIVQAMARQTAASSPDDFLTRFLNRLHSLSANQDLLVTNERRGIEIERLVLAQIAPFTDPGHKQIAVRGAVLWLLPPAAQGISMALHELSTNAVKYGALSATDGHVSIEWMLTDDEFSISWVESGGPLVRPPTRRGFGTLVMGSMAEASVAGTVDLRYDPQGLRWRLSCPAKNALNIMAPGQK